MKAIGILVIALALPHIIAMVWVIVMDFRSSGWIGLSWDSWFVGHLLGYLASVGVGCYLLFFGEWLLNQIIPSNRRYCPDCGYDVSEPLFAKRCAECGAVLPPDVAPNASTQ